jgi:hypothetical protein
MTRQAEGLMRRAEALVFAGALLIAAIAYVVSWLRGQ